MEGEHHEKSHECEGKVGGEAAIESQDRGLFDFMGKKEEKPQEEVIVAEFEKVTVCEPAEEPKEEEKHGGLLEKLHRSDSSSSSSSDEEVGEDGEKKKKKKKEKKGLKEKILGEKEEEEKHHHHEDTAVPIEVVHVEPVPSEEKKGFLDKIKDKLPGHSKKTEECAPPPPPPVVECAPEAAHHEAEPKKGILEKIKEKIPGYHPKSSEDEKEKEKECGSH